MRAIGAVHGQIKKAHWPVRKNVTNLILHHLTLSPSIIEYVKTENQVADGLTKALDKRRIEIFRNTIRLELA